MGRYSSVSIATRYGLDGPGIECRWGEIFRTRPDRPWGPPSLLFDGYRVSFPGVKRPGLGVDYRPPSNAEVKERVELQLYSPSGPSWPVLGWPLPLLCKIKQVPAVNITVSGKSILWHKPPFARESFKSSMQQWSFVLRRHASPHNTRRKTNELMLPHNHTWRLKF
jgi:hypothetical protein